jgi:hypothetical protein
LAARFIASGLSQPAAVGSTSVYPEPRKATAQLPRRLFTELLCFCRGIARLDLISAKPPNLALAPRQSTRPRRCVPPFSQPVFLSSRRSPSLRSARRSYYSIQHSLVLILRQISPRRYTKN